MSKLSSEKRNRLKDSDFGIPEKRMYPLHDKAHIESAVRLFGHAENKYKRSLARKILSRAREYNMDTSGWKQVLSFAQEQVPPMSNGTSIGNAPPRMMAPYYDEQDELLQRANSMDPNSKETMFDKAKRIVTIIHNKTEQDSQPPTGNQNCQLCTWCAEAQFRGINALPRPVYSPRDPALEIKGENIVIRPVRRSFTSQRDVVEMVRGAVDSRWYVHVNWAASTGGHEFLVVNLNDYAYIMDAQAGLLKEIDESDSSHNYFRDINFRNSYMVRLDDKEFNTKLFNEMNDPSKVMPWKNSLDIPYMRDNGMLASDADDDPRFRRVPVPSEEGTKYMKQDPELSQYWEELNKATTGEFLVDRETGEPIGHVFVHTNKNDKGFIFNLEVNPKYRRQGYGWILTDDAVRRLGGEDLTVDADNTPAINLYLQYGFTIYKKGQWHYDPPKDELWMKYDRSKLMKQESFIEEMLMLPFTDYDESLNLMYIIEADAQQNPNNGNWIQRVIQWCRNAIQFIADKIRSLFGKNKEVKTNKDIDELNNKTSSVLDSIRNNQPLDIEKLKSQLNSLKQNQEHIVDDNDLRIINKNINDINRVLKDANNLSQQYVQVLQKILSEYMEIVKSHDNQNKGNQTILKAMESTLMQNKSNGSDNIQVFPFVYSRTFYQDFDPVAALRPDKINIRTLQKMMQLVTRFDNGPTRAKAGFVDGYYVCGLITTAGELAKNVGYQPEIFDFKGRQYEKYIKDMFGRKMAISVGYIVSEDEVKKHGIPAVSFQMLWDVYLKTQEKIYFTPEGNNHTYTSSSITNVHSNPIPQNTNPPTNKDNIKQESFMDNLKTIGSVVKKGVNDFIFPDESDKELKLEPYTGDVPYQLYAVTKDGTVTEATHLFRTKRYALIKYSRKKVEDEVMSDTGLNRVNLRFEKGSDLYIPSTINCITYVDHDERNDLIADNDSVDIDGYCTTINTVNIPKENIKTCNGYLHITNLDSSDIFDTERFKCRFNVEIRNYGKDYDNNKYAYESFMDEYTKRVNDEGKPVPEKCKCGGKISITLKGEPIYSCEVCGKYYGTVPCNVQEGVVRNIRDMTLIPVKDFKYDKVYYGDPTDGGSVRKLDGKPLFVTPHMGLASIFVGRRHIFHKLSEMGYHEVNLGYDEWASTPDQPLTDVHVYVRNAPNLKPFTVEFDGYLHTIDCSQLKDNIYRYPWMSDTEHEILIAKVPEVKIDNVQKLHIRYHVRGIEEREPSTHVQEGAFQDLKNGVNPYSDNLVFHVTPDKHVDGQIWKPRVPDYLDPYNPEDTGFEDNTTPRICFSTSIEGALNGITVNLQRQSPDTFDKMYVYVPEKPWKEYKHKTNKQLVKDKLVYDANVTREVWIMEPVRMKLYGVIRVDQIADAKRKSVVPTSKGQKDTRNYFTYKWHWVVKPKVLKKATKFDYSPERVIDDLCIDIKKFKYGLIKDGKLQTGNVSDADYDKYWVFHSGETVDQAGGGNCYDMVEYEAGYLEAFGVPYKKYFMNFTNTKNTKTVNTHTICVVPHNGKFIYIEQAFKRVVDEWGHERKKVFDKLNDIFDYVAEVTAEYENQDLNYGVWDYTNAEIDYGTPIKNFMEWIFNNCTMIHDGEATKSKPTIKKEGYTLNRFKSRFFQEEEEALSDTEDMEDITIGDLNLDDGDDEEKEENEEKISISDEELEDGEDASTEKEDDEDLSEDMELPGYMKERMSEDDVESFEQPDENLNADNVDLGQFGKDTSDVQNDYDPKEIEILMKLMASEADAMNEYMDGAKETNVDVLRRLYADIANEERFHMEQLLFAKSELTGEKYQPKDPEVKSEYEELLKMGMDEETAMQTAVDRCHIRGSITDNDGDEMVEIQHDVETMEMAISMFNAHFDNIIMMMESNKFKKEDLDHAVDVFTEACCVQEEVYNTNTDDKNKGYLNQNKGSGPLDILKKALGFLLKLIGQLVSKFVSFLKRVRNHSRAIRTYVKKYGIGAIFASSKETVKMYFIDLEAPYCINDAAETFLSLVIDTYNACARAINSQQLSSGQLRRDPRFNIGGNIEKGIQILNGVQLIKSKMVIPKDPSKQEEIAGYLFGFTNERADDGSSANTLNRMKVYTDTWSVVMNAVSKILDTMVTLQTQQSSIYYSNRKKYDLVIKGFETIIKTCKAVVSALQNDINVLMKLNNEAMDISIKKTQEIDERIMNANPDIKQQNQNYKQNVEKGLK